MEFKSLQPLLSRKSAAERLGLSVRQLERFAVDGGGPPIVKIGKRALYDEKDLLDFVENRKIRDA